jgi:hypothetical protein
MKGDLRKVGSGVLSVAKVVGVFSCFYCVWFLFEFCFLRFSIVRWSSRHGCDFSNFCANLLLLGE